MRKTLTFFLIIASLLAGCLPAISPTAAAPQIPTETANGVYYEIFVRSFYDSNADGIGDFNGITQKLDYLSSLGITGIWLMPIFQSPSYHGYDVTDYYAVNPQYGTMDDFKNLLKEAHQRGINVIIDMVLNHTSDKHPWFKDAKKDVNSKYRDWYIWSKTDPIYKGPWGERVWHPSTTGYYYGIFESFMPDLNYNNPAVTKEMEKVTSFWLKDVGVDGFRLDAAKHLIEESVNQQNTAATHAWFKDKFYPYYKAINSNAITVGELSGDDLKTISNYVDNQQLDLAFNFPLADSVIKSVQAGKAYYFANTMTNTETVLKNDNYATFITNHDQNRSMSTFGGDVGKAKVAATLLLTSPGVPFIYYGEEIGMSGVKPDENIRRPMQWTADANAGFSIATPWRAPATDYKTVNVTAQENDSNSLLAHYRILIALRKSHSALRDGNLFVLDTKNTGVFAMLRISGNDVILVLINLTGESISDYALTLDDAALTEKAYTAKILTGGAQAESPERSGGGFSSYKPLNVLSPHSSIIIQFIP